MQIRSITPKLHRDIKAKVQNYAKCLSNCEFYKRNSLTDCGVMVWNVASGYAEVKDKGQRVAALLLFHLNSKAIRYPSSSSI